MDKNDNNTNLVLAKFFEIIEKKFNNVELTKDELALVFNGFLNKEITNYQISSFLMLIRCKGLTQQELINYVELIIESGEKLPTSKLNFVDKHSTGGIGDKITIILGPLLASLGIRFGKISGRALSFTGGTLDKLESIPGFNINLTIEHFVTLLDNTKIVIMAAQKEIAYLDKVIYAIRDVTGTVQSLPLIAASIMAKKIVLGAKQIIIDLKIGDGAFIKNIQEANELGSLMKIIANHFKVDLYVQFSSMEQPLGRYIGNTCEIKESLEIMSDYENCPEDIKQVINKLASEVIVKLQNVSHNIAQKMIENAFTQKLVYNKFLEWIIAQGGSVKHLTSPTFFSPKHRTIINSKTSGYVKIVDSHKFGILGIELGCGRVVESDKIKLMNGFKLFVKTGDKVEKYDHLVEIYSDSELNEEFLNNISNLFEILETKVKKPNLLLGQIDWSTS